MRLFWRRRKDDAASQPPSPARTSGVAAPHGWVALPSTDLAGERWAGALWRDQTVFAPASPDVEQFLAQRPLPYLWPDDSAYVDHVRGQGDHADRMLQLSWLEAFLHHPDDAVVVDSLRHFRSITLGIGLLGGLADVVTAHPSPVVRDEAARTIWTLKDGEIANVGTNLHSAGAIPSPHPSSALFRARSTVLAAMPAHRSELRRVFEDYS